MLVSILEQYFLLCKQRLLALISMQVRLTSFASFSNGTGWLLYHTLTERGMQQRTIWQTWVIPIPWEIT
ncbi:hypothetical protein LINPERHAP1_LOCUS23168 [Linum perenne]